MGASLFTGEGWTPDGRFGHPDDGTCFEVWIHTGWPENEHAVVRVAPGGLMELVERFLGEDAWLEATNNAAERSETARRIRALARRS